MAAGSHHGGSFHSGSHHSSSGGGGGFSGGFGGGYYSGGDYGSGSGGKWSFYLRLAAIPIYLTIVFIQKTAQGEVPGLSIFTLILTLSAYVIFHFSLENYDRFASLEKVKEGGRYIYGQVWKGSTPPQKTKNGNNRSWADNYGFYRIAFFDQDYGPENAKAVYDMMKRTPKIIWMNLYVWLIIALIATFSTFFFYETVIQIFENMIMTDEAFAVIDEVVFYTPSGLTILCAVASFIVVKVRDALLFKCAEGIVRDNLASDKRAETEEEIDAALNEKWYYNICPNCGAPASDALRSCTSCGSSLEVKDHRGSGDNSMHQIPGRTDVKREEKA